MDEIHNPCWNGSNGHEKREEARTDGKIKWNDGYEQYLGTHIRNFLSEGECEDYLESLEKLHVAHCGENSPFFAGKEVTYADFQLLVTFDLMKDMGYEELMAENAPNLARIARSVADLPQISEYIEENTGVAVVAAGLLF